MAGAEARLRRRPGRLLAVPVAAADAVDRSGYGRFREYLERDWLGRWCHLSEAAVRAPLAAVLLGLALVQRRRHSSGGTSRPPPPSCFCGEGSERFRSHSAATVASRAWPEASIQFGTTRALDIVL